MLTDRQRQGEHVKHGSLAGWAWNLVSLCKWEWEKWSRGWQKLCKKGRMETKYVCRWLRRKPERSIWSSLGLDGWIQHNALARHDTKIWTSLVFLAVRVVTVHMQQNVHRPMGSRRPSRLGFHVVSFSLQLHLFFFSQCGSWRRDLWGTSLWHQTLHFRFDDVNHLPSGKQRKEERDEEIHREPVGRKRNDGQGMNKPEQESDEEDSKKGRREGCEK